MVYQVTWLREFRLIFGASTPAIAAVLACFLAGLGAGSLILGRKVDGFKRPFRCFAFLELGVGLFAAGTPFLLDWVRQAYVALGGATALGLALGMVMRWLLAAAVLLVPTFLMGGALPAIVRAVQSGVDDRRRRAAALYGLNALGAVVGVMFATFYLAEQFGNRHTLWGACIFNGCVALVAWAWSRRIDSAANEEDGTMESGGSVARPAAVPELSSGGLTGFVVAAAALAGFALLLMEQVWHRMLSPLLGGSTFTWGLILAGSLLGIAAGSLGYSLGRGHQRATLRGFGMVCALEALFLIGPYALGDRLAVLAMVLQPLGSLSFTMRVVEWSIITLLIVFPASLLAGVQFPMLLALLGRARDGVGRHTGLVFGWHTMGAIAGVLAGGFGVLPLLTAPGAWRLVAGVLLMLALAALALSLQWDEDSAAELVVYDTEILPDPGRDEIWTEQVENRSGFFQRLWLLTPQVAVVALIVVLLRTDGPTAFWRHGLIATGQVKVQAPTPNELRQLANRQRWTLYWEAEGREGSVAVTRANGFALALSGKLAGNARSDAGTQVMLGLLPAMLHPEPQRGLVLGLGTGSTAGWLADVPRMQFVDVVEVEPAVETVAALCAPVNHHVLANPKVRLQIGDARDYLLTTSLDYDLIASEPANPFRPGAASLFTREFYQMVDRRLRPHGMFAQWIQGNLVDGETLAGAYATLSTVFPVVETWRTHNDDLLLIATREPLVYNVGQLRERIKLEPFKSALAEVWRVSDLEGVFAHYAANSALARAVAMAGASVNTDDQNQLEFAFARTAGCPTGFGAEILQRAAEDEKCDQPAVQNGKLNWSQLPDRRVSNFVVDQQSNFLVASDSQSFRIRTAAKKAWLENDLPAASRIWETQSAEPADLMELLVVAEGLADRADDRALPYIEKLRAWFPIEAAAVQAHLLWRQGKIKQALPLVEKSIVAWRQYPWTPVRVMDCTLDIARDIAFRGEEKKQLEPVSAMLEKPFALHLLDRERAEVCLEFAREMDNAFPFRKTRKALAGFEPAIPWNREFLAMRAECYRRTEDPRARIAAHDLQQFEAGEARPFPLTRRSQLAQSSQKSTSRRARLWPAPDTVQARETPAASEPK